MRSRTKRGLSFTFRVRGRAVRGLACFSALAVSVAFCAQAQAELLVSRYAVSLGGVRMGEAILHATIDAKHYKVEISADVGTLLNNTKVQGEASGSRTGQKLTPERYKLVMSDGQESSVDFAASAASGREPRKLVERRSRSVVRAPRGVDTFVRDVAYSLRQGPHRPHEPREDRRQLPSLTRGATGPRGS